MAPTIAGRGKEAARDCPIRRGPMEVQLRFATKLTFEEYRTQQGWEAATLSRCPV